MTASVMTGPRISTVTASSGVSAWLVEDRNLPVIAFDFAFLHGASHDPAGKSGALNLVSGLLDEGAGDLDAEAFQNALADHAIELSFSADRDDFRGALKTLSQHKSEAFRLRQGPDQRWTPPRATGSGLDRAARLLGCRLQRPPLWPAAAWHARNCRSHHRCRSQGADGRDLHAQCPEDRGRRRHRSRRACGVDRSGFRAAAGQLGA
jgi:hypothetical protein